MPEPRIVQFVGGLGSITYAADSLFRERWFTVEASTEPRRARAS
jgi:hypothetical protein